MNVKILIVDDEPLARNRLIRFVNDIPGVEISGIAKNADEAIQALTTSDFDVVLLDIRMPGQSGLAVAEKINNMSQPPVIIFCTAYDEYALNAFKVKAHSYLLKPIQRQDLVDALDTCRHLNKAQSQALGAEFNDPAITVQKGREKERVNLSEIHYFRAEGKYVVMYSDRGERIVDDSLKTLEEKFPYLLIRAHRSTLLHKHRIKKLVRYPDGSFWVVMSDEEEPLSVSRRIVKVIKQHFETQ